MKKLIYLIALLAATSAAEAQVIKEINSTVTKHCFNDKDAAIYAKAEKFIEEESIFFCNTKINKYLCIVKKFHRKEITPAYT